MDPFMMVWVFLIGIIIGVIVGVGLSYRTAVTPLHQRIGNLTSDPKQDTELMKYYPYNLADFRFIGDPITGVQFEDDKILFVLIKTDETLNTVEQDHIKKLIKKGCIEWFEVTMT
jgi:hypothetical protein